MPTVPPVNGVFVHLDWSLDRRRPELWIVVDVGEADAFDQGMLVPVPLFLDQPSLAASVTEAVSQTMPGPAASGADVARSNAGRLLPGVQAAGDLLGIVRPVVAVLLYLCSAQADVVDPDRPGARPRRAATPAEGPRVWEVGYRISTALRHPRTVAAGAGHHRSPEAHLRRAHWHTYWVGSLADPDQRRQELRWIQPMLIGAGQVRTALRDLG